MRKQLEETLARYEEQERQLTDPEVLANPQRLTTIMREHGMLARVATKYRRYKQLLSETADVARMAESDDEEERELAEGELPVLRKKRDELWNELLDLTIGGEDANRARCVMEIRAGTGGDEAALFVRDLYEMYRHHAEEKRWKVEVLDVSPTELGGLKEVILAFSGEGTYRELIYESGCHRVQRVPETETQGRVHTSTATVAVLPEPEDVEVDLKADDYRKDIFHASGPGGQHVNKTASAVRLTHYDTGIVVSMQDEKSQHKNLAKALRVLKSRIYEQRKRQQHEKRAAEKKTLAGSGERSQKIRTYNFPQSRITDHRINLSLYQLDQVLAGRLQPLTDALLDHDRNVLRSDMEEAK
jgi:peptide chain release factor 1